MRGCMVKICRAYTAGKSRPVAYLCLVCPLARSISMGWLEKRLKVRLFDRSSCGSAHPRGLLRLFGSFLLTFSSDTRLDPARDTHKEVDERMIGAYADSITNCVAAVTLRSSYSSDSSAAVQEATLSSSLVR